LNEQHERNDGYAQQSEHNRSALSSEEMTVNQVIVNGFAARGVAVLRR